MPSTCKRLQAGDQHQYSTNTCNPMQFNRVRLTSSSSLLPSSSPFLSTPVMQPAINLHNNLTLPKPLSSHPKSPFPSLVPYPSNPPPTPRPRQRPRRSPVPALPCTVGLLYITGGRLQHKAGRQDRTGLGRGGIAIAVEALSVLGAGVGWTGTVTAEIFGVVFVW